jgi:hypothetical protein
LWWTCRSSFALDSLPPKPLTTSFFYRLRSGMEVTILRRKACVASENGDRTKGQTN